MDKADLSNKSYVDQLLRQYDVTTSVITPASNDLFMIRSDSTLLNDDLRQYFHSAVAKLLYLGKRMRANILMVVIFLTTRFNIASNLDYKLFHRARLFSTACHNPSRQYKFYILRFISQFVISSSRIMLKERN
jgi:hypothetical protein